MNDDDLTTRFREALDGAAPDPQLWNRVESNVNRRTLSRRLTLGVAAIAIPATAFAAVAILPGLFDTKAPDVLTVDETPGGSPSPSASPQNTASPAYVAPIDLSPTVFAWADGNRVVLGDKAGTATSSITIDDADEIVALAGTVGESRQHVAAIVRFLDHDGAPQFRVDGLSWDRTTSAPTDIEHVTGQMFSQVADATYSAAFDNDGQLIVFFDNPVSNPGLNVVTLAMSPEVTVLEGKTMAVDGDRVRLDGFDGTGLAYATTGEGAIVVVDIDAGTSSNTAYSYASSWIFDGTSSRVLFSSDEAIWVLRDFPERGGMQEIHLPFDAVALDAADLRLLNGPFGVTHLRFGDQLWRYDAESETDPDRSAWVRFEDMPESLITFTAAPDLPRPVKPVDQSGWTSEAITGETRLDEGGIGSLRVGMSLREARAITGQEFVVSYDFEGYCFPARIEGVEGLYLTFLPDGDGPVADDDALLATVDSLEDRGAPGNRTTKGVGPGMTRDDVFAAYDGVAESPNAYDPSSSYLDIDGQGELGIRFNVTPDGIIRSVSAGNGHRKALEGCA